MTESQFQQWLEDYLRPQEQRTADRIKELFTENGVYHWGPFQETRFGINAIYEQHRNALSRQDDIHYDYQILAVTETFGIAHFHLTIREIQEARHDEYDGIFKVHLDRTGRCTLFEEWYHSRLAPNPG